MNIITYPGAAPDEYPTLRFMDGTSSQNSYVAVARRGTIFLGSRFLGLMDGAHLGVPQTVYLSVRVRSARDQALAKAIDLEHGCENVVSLSDQQLPVDKAWPCFVFDKIDAKRASLVIGMFVNGSLTEVGSIVTRIEEADLLRKLVDYVTSRAGLQYRIARGNVAAAWLFDQAKPLLDHMKQEAEHKKVVLEAQNEFAGLVHDQIEVVGPHLQQFNAIYHQHQVGS